MEIHNILSTLLLTMETLRDKGMRKTMLSRGPDSIVGLSSNGNVVASTRCQGRPQRADDRLNVDRVCPTAL